MIRYLTIRFPGVTPQALADVIAARESAARSKPVQK